LEEQIFLPIDHINRFFTDDNNNYDTNKRQIFHIRRLTNIENNLNEQQKNQYHEARCDKCGFPLKLKEDLSQDEFEKNNDEKGFFIKRDRECFVCRRTKILNIVLIGSYVFFALLFIACIVGVIFDQMALDIALIIGCLELIFLLFFGRFLEEAVFFGLPNHEKALAAFYRFADSGELQAYDIAFQYLKRINEEDISSKLYTGLLHIILLQAGSIPFRFYEEISKELNISTQELLVHISQEISSIDESYMNKLLLRAPPIGISSFAGISLQTECFPGYNFINNRLSELFNSEEIENNWKQDFFINKTRYTNIFTKINNPEKIANIDSIIESYKIPNVPSIDVVESSRKIMNSPLIRYVIRILTYILLAILLGWLYRLLE